MVVCKALESELWQKPQFTAVKSFLIINMYQFSKKEFLPSKMITPESFPVANTQSKKVLSTRERHQDEGTLAAKCMIAARVPR